MSASIRRLARHCLCLLPLCAALQVHAADGAPAAASAPEPAKAVATVNGTPIPMFFLALLQQTVAGRNVPPEAVTVDALRNVLIEMELLAQDAVRKGLDKDAEIQLALEFQRRDSLRKAALGDFLRTHPLSEDTLKAEYEKAKAAADTTEYRVSHILVKTEKEALDVLAQLKKPKASFAALAKKYSKDTSAGNGGDLGWVSAAGLVPEFSQAMKALKKGETSAKPVQTQFGWHIIKMNDTRTAEYPDFEMQKDRLAQRLQQQAMRRYIQELRATARVE